MPYTLRSNDRLLVVGKTGSGKTYLMRHLTARIQRLVVLDGKATLTDWNLTTWDRESRDLLSRGEPVRVRVVLDINEPDPTEFWSGVLAQCYKAGSLTIYIDELYSIVEPGKPAPPILTGLYTRGRELDIGVWSGTQRPVWIPLVALTEAEHFFMFRLTLSEDRERMAAFMTETVRESITDVHGFWYMRPEWNRPVYQKEYHPSGSVQTSNVRPMGQT